MNARLLDVLHDRANHHVSPVADRIDVHLDGTVQEVVQQHRAVVGHLNCFAQVTLEFVFLINDFHRAAAQYIGGTHHQRITDLRRSTNGFVFATHSGVWRLTQVEALDHLLEALTVFGTVNGVRAGADDRHTGRFKGTCQFQRRLATVLDDHTFRLLDPDDFKHVFQGDRLEVQAVRGVVIGGNGFRVAVDHDGLVPVFTQRQGRVYTAVVELDTLADTVRATAEDHDLVARRRVGFALFFVRRVQVRGVGCELGGAGVDALVDREHVQLVTMRTQVLFGNADQLGQARIGEALALEAEHQVTIDCRQAQRLDLLFVLDQIFDLHQEPGVNHVHGEDFFNRHACAEGVGDVPDTLGTRHSQLALERAHAFRVAQVQLRIETANADFQAAQGFLQGLLESAADGHDFTDRLHLSGQTRIRLGELLEGKARQLGDDVVDRRFERSRGLAAGDFVRQLVKGVTHCQLGGNACNREAGRLGGQRRGTRYARVHLDHDHTAGVRADAELNVGTTGFNADLAQHCQRGITQDLVFLVGQGLCRSNGDGVAGVHAHRVEVFNRADDDAVVLFVADNFHFVLFPADQRFVDQQLFGRRQVQTASADFFELFTVVRDTAARAAHGERWTNNAREAELFENRVGFFHAVRDTGTRARQADRLHGLVETRAVFSLVDGIGVGTDHLHAELLQNAFALQIQCAVQSGLAAHGRQQCVRTLFFDDLGNGLPLDRLDVGRVGHGRVGHDGGRVGVHQDDAVTLFAQCPAGLGAGVVEFTGLADHDRAGAENQDAFNICTFWHGLSLKSAGQSASRLEHFFEVAWAAATGHLIRGRPGHLRITVSRQPVSVAWPWLR
ncbi:hypothetical protein ALP35_05604 [Pseudomonas savastanoi pv. glycinea]|nr:hypothetical protein ALP35_05604 [Pseudomonas savastanoi pv. glycinea]